MTSIDELATDVPASKRFGYRPRFGLLRTPTGAFGVVVIILLFAVAAFPSAFASHAFDAQDIVHRLESPSSSHYFGTDEIGRDVYSRLIYAIRSAFLIAIPAVLIAVVCGLAIGLVAGYFGGVADSIGVVVLDSIQAFPPIILALALVAALGTALWSLTLVIGIAFLPGYARVARGMVLNARHSDFVDVERVLGARPLRIILMHLLPTIFSPLVILMAIDLPAAVVIESGLSFLGLGVQPPTPSLGSMLFDGFQYVRTAPWLVLAPGLTLMILTLAFTLVGERLRDLADPRTTANLPRVHVGVQ